jgi:hypothetical protein
VYNAVVMIFTHRHYFRTYKLSPAQYGEILVAAAVSGEKKGDAQPCYDVLADAAGLRVLLKKSNVDPESPAWPHHEEKVRIQVRSKLTHTPAGKPSVIQCKESDFKQMTQSS